MIQTLFLVCSYSCILQVQVVSAKSSLSLSSSSAVGMNKVCTSSSSHFINEGTRNCNSRDDSTITRLDLLRGGSEVKRTKKKRRSSSTSSTSSKAETEAEASVTASDLDTVQLATDPSLLLSSSSPPSKDPEKVAFTLLANALQSSIHQSFKEENESRTDTNKVTTVRNIVTSFQHLSKSQSALKAIDGTSHAFYQQSHSTTTTSSSGDGDGGVGGGGGGVKGRAARSAARTGCCADALFACELLDLFIHPPSSTSASKNKCDDEELEEDGDDMTTLDLGGGRQVLLNITIPSTTATTTPTSSSSTSTSTGKRTRKRSKRGGGSSSTSTIIPMQILVLYEPNYNGGGGMEHGGIDALLPDDDDDDEDNDGSTRKKGRILIAVKDEYESNLSETLKPLDDYPEFLDLEVGLVAQEIASVNRKLWKSAYELLKVLEPILRNEQPTKDETQSKIALDNTNNNNKMDEDEDAKEKEVNENDDGENTDNDKEKEDEKKEKPLPVIHFVGRSLAGGVISLAAAMLDGSIPIPTQPSAASSSSSGGTTGRKRRRRSASINRGGGEAEFSTSSSSSLETTKKTSRRSKKRSSRQSSSSSSDIPTTSSTTQDDDHDDNERKTTDDEKKESIDPISLCGLGKGRTSAVAIGSPPSLSANVKAPFITTVINGDDIICRATKDSLDRLRKRTTRSLKSNVFTKRMSWMTDAVSLTVSGLQSHAHGSEGEEGRLSLPGKVYLVRPRRIGGGVSSMHEIGNASGREALRAAVLWSLKDVLLSRSLWAHHSLESYIRSLDKVQLREFYSDEPEEEFD